MELIYWILLNSFNVGRKWMWNFFAFLFNFFFFSSWKGDCDATKRKESGLCGWNKNKRWYAYGLFCCFFQFRVLAIDGAFEKSFLFRAFAEFHFHLTPFDLAVCPSIITCILTSPERVFPTVRSKKNPQKWSKMVTWPRIIRIIWYCGCESSHMKSCETPVCVTTKILKDGSDQTWERANLYYFLLYLPHYVASPLQQLRHLTFFHFFHTRWQQSHNTPLMCKALNMNNVDFYY